MDTEALSIPDPSSKSILVIDDEEPMTALFQLTLESACYNVLTANTSADAEKIFQEHTFDLVLLDIVLPGKSGIELLEGFKASKPNVPVVMITGSGRVQHAVDCFKYGAADLLPKPITMPDLLKAVSKNLSRSKPVRSEISQQAAPNIEGYRFIRILGEGNMGIVYLAQTEDPDGTAKKYAVKVFKVSMADSQQQNELLKQRFMQEARAAFSVQHPNVIKVYDFSTDADGTPYIIMEYFEGQPLNDYALENDLDQKHICTLLIQISQALQVIHESGICHRDIKPTNILVDITGTAKVMDFGIARVKDSTLTMTAHIMGTPAFMSPEAFESAKVDYRSDIFSFGSLSYELFTGQRPFNNQDLASLAYSIRFDTPRLAHRTRHRNSDPLGTRPETHAGKETRGPVSEYGRGYTITKILRLIPHVTKCDIAHAPCL